ncbi:hypothetical protein [Nocardia farcinica]|uniref:Putative phage tail n=1 Tax=Nocardia farcinica (strain IFM 10152) TaxID=247156 RepID=Q5Z3U3_NOCFA|nr:hypothetical protein [Nocardia farcinica]BAD54898.1 putative phage tail [Nocardia farcinica IFM 10152]
MSEIVYEADVTVTMRAVDDGGVGLPYTVNPLDLVEGEALVEVREGAPGGPGPIGAASWPWQWMGDIADRPALDALGLGQAEKYRAWRVVAENAIYYWTGESFIRFRNAFGAPGPAGPVNVLTASAVAGPPGSTAAAQLTGTAPTQHLELTLPRGPQGPIGPPGQPGAISESADVGDMSGAVQDSVLAWRTTPGQWQPVPPPRLLGPWAVGGSQISGGSQIAQSPKVLATMTIPAQPIAWRPLVLSGQVNMLIHVQSLNQSRTDIEVRLGSIDGDLLAYGHGVPAVNKVAVLLRPCWFSAIGPNSTQGVIAANTTASLYIVARRVSGSRPYTIVSGGSQMFIVGQPIGGVPA